MIALPRCGACGAWVHPPRPICRVCLSDAIAPAEHTGRATVLATATVRRGFDPAWAGRLPLAAVTVLLDDGPQLIAAGSAPPGARVRVQRDGALFHAEACA